LIISGTLELKSVTLGMVREATPDKSDVAAKLIELVGIGRRDFHFIYCLVDLSRRVINASLPSADNFHYQVFFKASNALYI